MSGGAELVLPPEAVRRHTADQFNRPNAGQDGFAMAWTAALRLIEDGKPDYRS